MNNSKNGKKTQKINFLLQFSLDCLILLAEMILLGEWITVFYKNGMRIWG